MANPATGPGSPLTVTGLVNGTPYLMRVRARNAQGWGPYSAPTAFTPTATSGLYPATNLYPATTLYPGD